MSPRKIVIDMTGQAWGGVLEIAKEHIVSTHIVIGSMFPDRAAYESHSPLRMLDGRVELGVPVNGAPMLGLTFVADGKAGSVSRDQTMTAVRICALWRSIYRGERGRIPIEPSPSIQNGTYRFDIDKFRTLVMNWEVSNRIMREYPSKHAMGE